jgi:membrane protease YdiL (CAAX protease family)
VLPYEPRKPVPWRGAHLLILAAAYIGLQVVLALVLQIRVADRPATASPDKQRATSEHLVVQALVQGDRSVLLLCAIAVVIVAPVVEEFLFRVLLQGWLEASERRLRRRRFFRRTRGLMPIVTSSLLFAAVHFRLAKPELTAHQVVSVLAANLLANALMLGFAIVFLRAATGATAVDFGWQPRRLAGDIVTGLFTFVIITPMIYLLQLLLQEFVLPASVAADPIPLFVLAVVLGFLYFRTHRIAPSVVVHAALNAASLTLAWLQLRQ